MIASGKCIGLGLGKQAAGMLDGIDAPNEGLEAGQAVGAGNEPDHQTASDASGATRTALGKAKQATGHTMMKIVRHDRSHHLIGAK
jgi:hypothetical protein